MNVSRYGFGGFFCLFFDNANREKVKGSQVCTIYNQLIDCDIPMASVTKNRLASSDSMLHFHF